MSIIIISSSISSLISPVSFISSIPPSHDRFSAKMHLFLNLDIQLEKYFRAFVSGFIPMLFSIPFRIWFCSFVSVIRIGSMLPKIIFLLSLRIFRKIECIVPMNGDILLVLALILFVMSFAALFVNVVIRI